MFFMRMRVRTPLKFSLHSRASGTPNTVMSSRLSSAGRSEEHTSELQSPCNLVCRLLLEKKKKKNHRLVLIYPKKHQLLSSPYVTQHTLNNFITLPLTLTALIEQSYLRQAPSLLSLISY